MQLPPLLAGVVGCQDRGHHEHVLEHTNAKGPVRLTLMSMVRDWKVEVSPGQVRQLE